MTRRYAVAMWGLCACAAAPPPCPAPAPPSAVRLADDIVARARWSIDHGEHRPQGPMPTASAFGRGTIEGAGLDRRAVEALVAHAEEHAASALVIVHRGDLVVDWRSSSGDPAVLETMSVTKSFVALALALLKAEGKLSGYALPVHEVFPSWRVGAKARVTLEHLLTHTSGLDNPPSRAIYSAPDATALALSADLVSPVGGRFAYNNLASHLAAALASKVAGERLDRYLARRLFRPLGITQWSWQLDPQGTALGMAGLRMHAYDMAKVGQVLLDDGLYRGVRVLPEGLLAELGSSSGGRYEGCGRLWWRRLAWTQMALEPEVLARWTREGVSFAPKLKGLQPAEEAEFVRQLRERLGPAWRERMREEVWSKKRGTFTRRHGPLMAVYADGWLGQTIFIWPQAELVVVRQAPWLPRYQDAQAAPKLGDLFGMIAALRPGQKAP